MDGLKWFVLASMAFHLLAAGAFYSMPARPATVPEKPYTVSIVSPKERPAKRLPPPKLKKPRAAKPPRIIDEKPPKPPVARKPPKEAHRAAPPPEVMDQEGAPGAPSEKEARKKADEKAAGQPAAPGRARLFDPEVMAGVLRRNEPGEGKDSSITFNTKELKYYGYMQRLKQRIEAVWDYPRAASARGIYGDLVIRFVINRDGTLRSAKVVRVSGHRVLDEAAIAAIKDGAPYWPLPKDWEEDSLSIMGHFMYTLYGTYVR